MFPAAERQTDGVRLKKAPPPVWGFNSTGVPDLPYTPFGYLGSNYTERGHEVTCRHISAELHLYHGETAISRSHRTNSCQ